ncbi:MAG: hypothetical protein AB1792_06495 [Candidatus Zixiibacteriota bacterium]
MPDERAQRGREIYATKLKAILEPNYIGLYVAIEVQSGDYYLGDSPEEAVASAESSRPGGVFHLMRVGFGGAYHLTSLFGDTANREL